MTYIAAFIAGIFATLATIWLLGRWCDRQDASDRNTIRDPNASKPLE